MLGVAPYLLLGEQLFHARQVLLKIGLVLVPFFIGSDAVGRHLAFAADAHLDRIALAIGLEILAEDIGGSGSVTAVKPVVRQ